MAKGGPDSGFLGPGMALGFIFDGFSCVSVVCVVPGRRGPGSWPFLGNVGRKRAGFCRKWVRSLWIAVSGISCFLPNKFIITKCGSKKDVF